MLFNLQLLVKKRMSGDERINAPPVCIFQIIVALYQSRTPLGNANDSVDTPERNTPHLGNCLIYGLLKHLASRVHFFIFR